ncbi:MAG: hypothetical protein ACRCVX_12835 [Shewanella sp.]
MSITGIIAPIKLLAGSHADTAKTGQGCFMNVIAYLNGEPQITDSSPCVCVTVRHISIGLNDRLNDTQRARMIPFIERAMGSADCDKDEFKRRLNLMVDFAKKQAGFAKSAANAAANAANAADYAANAADNAEKIKEEIIESCFEYLDAVLPKREWNDGAVIARAEQLCALA